MTVSGPRDESFVRRDILDILKHAMENDIIEEVSYTPLVEAELLAAQTYGEDGEVEKRWVVEIFVKEVAA